MKYTARGESRVANIAQGEIHIILCVGGSKQKECFIYHEVASVLYEK